MRAKLGILFAAIGAISFLSGLGLQQFSEAKLGSGDLSLTFGFESSGTVIECLIDSDCNPPEVCFERQCIDPNPSPMNLSIKNISNDPVTLTGAFVGIDRDPTTKVIEGYFFPLKEFLQPLESFSVLFDLVDLEGNPLDIPEKKFQLAVDAEKVDDTTRGGDEPKVKEIKVKKSFKFKDK